MYLIRFPNYILFFSSCPQQLLSIYSVEVNEAQPNEESKSYLFWTCCRKGVNHHHLHFGRDSKAGREVSKLYSGKTQKASGVPWLEAVGMGELEVG